MLSIIVPIYNSEKYLVNCIDSLINQTYQNLEIILVDDGSLDNSYQICKSYAEQDNRIIVLRKENGGPSSAKNLGLSHATGSYITFVDSDDAVQLDTYEQNLKIIEKTPDIEVIQFPCVVHYNSPAVHTFEPKEQYLLNNSAILENWLISKQINWIVCNKIFRSEILKNIKFPEKMLFEDNYLLADVIQRVKHFYISKHGKYLYYCRANSITNSEHTLRKELSLLEVNKKIYKIADSTPSIHATKVAFLNKLLHNAISLQNNFNHNHDKSFLSAHLKKTSFKDLFTSNLTAKAKIKLCLAKIFGLYFFLNLHFRYNL